MMEGSRPALTVHDLLHSPLRMWAKVILRIAIIWVVVSIPMIINRGPFYYPDTSAYIRVADAAAVKVTGAPSAWSDRLAKINVNPDESAAPASTSTNDRVTPLSGRSVYYGAFLYAADRLGGLWFAALWQALLVAAALTLCALRMGRSWAPLPVAALVSGVGITAAFLMPDIFAALAILSVGMIAVFWHPMRNAERVFWMVLLCAGTLTHSATLLIVVAVLFVLYWYRKQLSLKPVVAGALIGLVGEIAFNTAVTRTLGAAPLRPPFLSARLIDDGPGLDYLKVHCPDPGLVLCGFYRDLPGGSDRILWSDGGKGFISMPVAVQRAWSKQDMHFAALVFADQPVNVVASTAGSVLKQAMGLNYRDITEARVGTKRYPASAASAYERTAASARRFPHWPWDVLAWPLLIASAVILFVTFRRDRSPFIPIIAAGIVADVLICGALSTPHDRYLTRVIWLLPVLASLSLPQLWADRGRARRQATAALAANTPSNSRSSEARSP